MKALYDSESNVLSIDLIDARPWDGVDELDGDYGTLALVGGVPANIELIAPAEHLELLNVIAAKYELDYVAINVAARSALEAPDRQIVLEVSART